MKIMVWEMREQGDSRLRYLYFLVECYLPVEQIYNNDNKNT